jgi:phage FluMu gp28-like protein
MATLTLTMPRLHDGQVVVRDDATRFKVLACGRRWGKTRLGTALCIAEAAAGRRAWWVAPSYKMGHVGWRGVTRLAQQIPGAEVRKVDRMVILPGGGEVTVRSADDPDSLRGEGLDFVVMDECAFMQEKTWTEALRPALSDRQGGALFISTPKGRNWFWRMWAKGQDAGDVQSWRFPTASNPFIVAGEIEAARQSLPERIFSQEYLAEFLDDAGGVFRRVVEASTGKVEQPQAGRQYAIGVDWARDTDYTVFSVVDIADRRQVFMDRMSGVDYNAQIQRLRALNDRYRPTQIIAEYNSMGGPLVEQLQRDGIPVTPFTTTNTTKQAAIDALALAFEQGTIVTLLDQVQIAELQAYEFDRTPSGMIRYSAPEGMHDDTVMALALAWQAIARGSWAIW